MLERADIAALADRLLAAFLAAHPEGAEHYIPRVTSNTTGGDPIVNVVDHRGYPESLAGWYLNSSRRLVCYGSLYIRFLDCYAQLVNPRTSVATLPIDGRHATAAIGPLIAEFKPDAVMGFVSFILRIMEHIDRETAAGVREVGCMGEMLTADTAARLQQTFPNATIRTLYTSSEIGAISKVTCGKLPASQYHPREGLSIAIDEPDEHGVGDLVVSGTVFGSIPVDAYRIGDVARIIKEPCACGEQVTFELLGRRGYDYVKFVGALLVKAEFDRVMSMFREVSDYRARASQDSDAKGTLTLTLHTPQVPSEGRTREIAETISRELFVTAYETFGDMVRRGVFAPLVTEWQTEPFPYERKAIKLKRV